MSWMTLSRRPSKPWMRIAIAVLAVAGTGIAAMVGLIWFALEGFASCRNVVLSSTPSPDGTKAVLVFRQECNATVPDSTYASIAPMDSAFSPDRNHAFLGFAGNAEILPTWRGSNVVEIAMMPGVEGGFIRHDAQVGSVRIDYK
ncbi:hypothetical protein EOW77_0033820 [Bradyrhizobium yuanmingense]|uniref:hypothetical protein n=1 Tax=Bradyrhizobium yuanmingense TaxID=108015 RepID=UPI000FE2F5B6|nr:hypothetical protein [Bradyrhizobium yuanmingense]TGN74304.1 hypothetical protein EOW77_0033820 [Bradyrhizobium yuanmingense]